MVFQNILDMREMLEREDRSFQLVIVPIFPVNFDNYPLHDMHKEIGIFLRENGVRFLDLLKAFTEGGKLPTYYCFDVWHPNVEGHRLIAQQLLPWVLWD